MLVINGYKGSAFQIVEVLCFKWAVKTPPTAGRPGWCPHQPATI